MTSLFARPGPPAKLFILIGFVLACFVSAATGASAERQLLASAEKGDNRVTAIAYMDPDDDRRSVLEVNRSGSTTPVSVQINGTVRSLLFGPEDSLLYAVVHRSAKRRPDTTMLISIDVVTGKTARLISLPLTASGLEFWPERDSLLVACRDELRSYQLPGFQSGPLYRILGANRSLEQLSSGSAFAVGQENGLVVVDLSDPHGKEQMPVRGRLETDSAVISVQQTADGEALLVILTGREEPLLARLGELVDSISGAEPVPAGPQEQAIEPEPALAEEEIDIPEPEPAPVVETDKPEPTPAPPITEPRETVGDTETMPQPEPETDPAEPARPLPPDHPPVPQPEINRSDPPTGSEDDTPGVRGRLTGPAAGMVGAVVFLGPDNFLREADRVSPDPSGNWTARGLAPGTYRIVLDAGGDRVAHSRPPFRLVVVEAGKPVTVEPFQVIRVE